MASVSITLDEILTRLSNIEKSGNTSIFVCEGIASGNDVCGKNSSIYTSGTSYVNKSGDTYTVQPGQYMFDIMVSSHHSSSDNDSYANTRIQKADGTVLWTNKLTTHAVWWGDATQCYSPILTFSAVTQIKVYTWMTGTAGSIKGGYVKITRVGGG